MSERFVISVLVANKRGVLARVSSLFSRRGYNIDSLTVSETHDKNTSRMTIVLNGDEHILSQMMKQVSKLIDVVKVERFQQGSAVFRELLLIKVEAQPGNRSAILEAVNIFRGKIVDLSNNSLTVELTGDSNKISAFVDLISQYGIIEMCKTGLTAIGRGDKSIYH